MLTMIALALSILASSSLFAGQNKQGKSKDLALGVDFSWGTILKHSKQIAPLAYNDPKGAELTIFKLNHTDKAIEHLGYYAYAGAGIRYVNFSHPEIGKSLQLYGFIEPVLFRNQIITSTLRAGTGAAYLSNIYHPTNNPRNKFFASHIAFLLTTNLSIRLKVTDQLHLTTSIHYNHISNGGIKQPNYGMNYPSLSVGVLYEPNKVIIQPLTREKFDRSTETLTLFFGLLSSFKVHTEENSGKQEMTFMHGISVYSNYRISRLSRINGGLNYFADGYLKNSLIRSGESTDHRRVGLFIGHDLLFGQLTLTTNLGAYIYSPKRAKDPVYQKYILFYAVSKWFSTGVFMIAHGDAADTMGLHLVFGII